jgi:4-hydroxybenzoate polyprenyltransferase
MKEITAIISTIIFILAYLVLIIILLFVIYWVVGPWPVLFTIAFLVVIFWSPWDKKESEDTSEQEFNMYDWDDDNYPYSH